MLTGMAVIEKIFPTIKILSVQVNYLIHHHHVQSEHIFVKPV